MKFYIFFKVKYNNNDKMIYKRLFYFVTNNKSRNNKIQYKSINIYHKYIYDIAHYFPTKKMADPTPTNARSYLSR